ncbi:MAG: tryptophan--tRNA ligase [Rickettsiales bacterium]|nr:tryptophan--tRNA ligase [Rickettsiales bacterium]
MRKTILSGVQPTGNLHLGNYLGSIRNWLNLQNEYDCLFGIMNLHAITIYQEPKILKESIINTIATYLACGLDPEKNIIFLQSEISEHVELAWVLACNTSLGWLNRMTQFKEKSANNENLGLYSYPVLMASDILLYNADLVPVGEDQKQHLELARDLAGSFNRQYQENFFKLPEPLIVKQVKRIMSLQDGTKKMSKSDISDLSRINLTDESDIIIKKIKKAKTDSINSIEYQEQRPEIYNLLNIFASFTNQEPVVIANQYQNLGYGRFKNDLAEILVEKIKPIQQNIAKLKNEQHYLLKILNDGSAKAKEIAYQNRNKIFSIIGFK